MPMLDRFKGFLDDDSGATAVEYALLGSLIAMALVVVLGDLGLRVSQQFSEVSSGFK